MMTTTSDQAFVYTENESFDKQEVKNNKRKIIIPNTYKNEESIKTIKVVKKKYIYI